jgi:hypothetical protein
MKSTLREDWSKATQPRGGGGRNGVLCEHRAEVIRVGVVFKSPPHCPQFVKQAQPAEATHGVTMLDRPTHLRPQR